VTRALWAYKAGSEFSLP